MKRTPVLIDVNGVPLRESLSYNGGGAGFGGQMAEWLPPAQSADAALLPALRLGNARADDLVRNNGIAANAVALHKDHIVGHMFSYQATAPKLALAGDAGDRDKKFCR